MSGGGLTEPPRRVGSTERRMSGGAGFAGAGAGESRVGSAERRMSGGAGFAGAGAGESGGGTGPAGAERG